MGTDVKVSLDVKHDAKDGSPGTWGPSTLKMALKADKALVDKVEAAIRNALAVEVRSY